MARGGAWGEPVLKEVEGQGRCYKLASRVVTESALCRERLSTILGDWLGERSVLGGV